MRQRTALFLFLLISALILHFSVCRWQEFDYYKALDAGPSDREWTAGDLIGYNVAVAVEQRVRNRDAIWIHADSDGRGIGLVSRVDKTLSIPIGVIYPIGAMLACGWIAVLMLLEKPSVSGTASTSAQPPSSEAPASDQPPV